MFGQKDKNTSGQSSTDCTSSFAAIFFYRFYVYVFKMTAIKLNS